MTAASRSRWLASACSRAFVIAIAACVANSSTSVASASVNRRPGSRLNTMQLPMIEPAQRMGTPITPWSDPRSRSAM